MYMLASTVSSKFIQSMGNVEGFQFEVRSNHQALHSHPYFHRSYSIGFGVYIFALASDTKFPTCSD